MNYEKNNLISYNSVVDEHNRKTEETHKIHTVLKEQNIYTSLTKNEVEKKFIIFFDENKDKYNLNIKHFITPVTIDEKKYLTMTVSGYIHRHEKETIKSLFLLKEPFIITQLEHIDSKRNNFEFELALYESYKDEK
jgi:hypothetical protein